MNQAMNRMQEAVLYTPASIPAIREQADRLRDQVDLVTFNHSFTIRGIQEKHLKSRLKMMNFERLIFWVITYHSWSELCIKIQVSLSFWCIHWKIFSSKPPFFHVIKPILSGEGQGEDGERKTSKTGRSECSESGGSVDAGGCCNRQGVQSEGD